MKQILLLLSNLIFLFSFSQELANSLLWKIEKDGMTPSYLFGTIHVLPQADFILENKVKTAFGESEELVMELDMTDPTLQARMMEMMTMSGGVTLDQLLTKQQYAELSKKLQTINGMPPLATINSFKPFMIATMMLNEFVGSQPASFEMTLMSMASARALPVSGLETIEHQMSIFDSIPYADQVSDLMDMVKRSDEMKALFTSMVNQYKAEEVNALYATTAEYMDSDAEMGYLLHSRNMNWAELLDTRLGADALFVAVGAAHLGGEKGVIELLRKRGYRVTAVMD